MWNQLCKDTLHWYLESFTSVIQSCLPKCIFVSKWQFNNENRKTCQLDLTPLLFLFFNFMALRVAVVVSILWEESIANFPGSSLWVKSIYLLRSIYCDGKDGFEGDNNLRKTQTQTVKDDRILREINFGSIWFHVKSEHLEIRFCGLAHYSNNLWILVHKETWDGRRFSEKAAVTVLMMVLTIPFP